MKILAVDTATKSCSVALTEDDAVLAETTTHSGQTHSRHLLNIVDAVIARAGLTLNQIDGFAVSIGPGSFTGLRIGISTVKGLAYGRGRPVVGVSSLEALSRQCPQTPQQICAMIDARKQEVYFCFYSTLR